MLNLQNAAAAIDAKANVCSVQFSPTDANLMAFGGANYRTYLYDLRHIQVTLNPEIYACIPTNCCKSARGRLMCSKSCCCASVLTATAAVPCTCLDLAVAPDSTHLPKLNHDAAAARCIFAPL